MQEEDPLLCPEDDLNDFTAGMAVTTSNGNRTVKVNCCDALLKQCLELIDALCRESEFCLDMELQRGDMQFVCNFTVLHSRSAYEDWPERERRRYLLRLWLRTPQVAQLPASWAERYEDMALWRSNPSPPVFDLSARRDDLVH